MAAERTAYPNNLDLDSLELAQTQFDVQLGNLSQIVLGRACENEEDVMDVADSYYSHQHLLRAWNTVNTQLELYPFTVERTKHGLYFAEAFTTTKNRHAIRIFMPVIEYAQYPEPDFFIQITQMISEQPLALPSYTKANSGYKIELVESPWLLVGDLYKGVKVTQGRLTKLENVCDWTSAKKYGVWETDAVDIANIITGKKI